MKKFADGLALLALNAWVGVLWGIGYVAVQVLFQALPDKTLAGMLAGKMLTQVVYIGMASACYLLVYYLSTFGRAAFKQAVFWMVVVMLLLTMVQFGIQPIMADLKAQALPAEVMKSAFAGSFRAWHGIASILYLLQSLLGAVLVLKTKERS